MRIWRAGMTQKPANVAARTDMKNPTRQDDEILLALLDSAAQGFSWDDIAAALNLSPMQAVQRMAAVRDSDIRHDPTAARYWAAVNSIRKEARQ